MAKITDIKIEFKGQELKLPVHVKSDGTFNSNLPEPLAEALSIDKHQCANTLSELAKKIADALGKYKNSTTTIALFLFIKFGARGYYTMKKDSKGVMFGGYRHKYDIDVSLNDIDVLGFKYRVAFVETTDGNERIYTACKGKDLPHWELKNMEERGEIVDENKYYKESKTSLSSTYKRIPYTEEAENSLFVIREKIRDASETLFNFIELDEIQLSEGLNNNKILLPWIATLMSME